jgi:hypothetical protein
LIITIIFGFLGRQTVPLFAGDLTGFAGNAAGGVDKESFAHFFILFLKG